MTGSIDDPQTASLPLSLPPAETLIDGYTYSLFITLVALNSMVVSAVYYLLPLPLPVKEVLYIVDLLNSLILLADFFERLRRSPLKLAYLFPRGGLDFLGSLPGLPLLRFFRLFQILRTAQQLRHVTPKEVRVAARRRLAESTLLVVAAVGLVVITLGSIAIVLVEAPSPEANIRTGSDAVWWALVTIATVGYGDRYPVTDAGRAIGVVMIILGVSIFSVLTSFIASVFIKRSPPNDRGEADNELAALRAEVAALRHRLERDTDNQLEHGSDGSDG